MGQAISRSFTPRTGLGSGPGYGLGVRFLGHPSLHPLGGVCSKGQCPRWNSDLSGNSVAKEGSWERLPGARDLQRARPGTRAKLAGRGMNRGRGARGLRRAFPKRLTERLRPLSQPQQACQQKLTNGF